MWCPKCKNEYRPGIGRCSDCNVNLVESLDNLPPEHDLSGELCNKDASDMPENESTINVRQSALPDDDTADHTADFTQSVSSHAYVSKKTKTEDLKSTAYTFTLVGSVGIILLILFGIGVIPLHTSGYMKIMLCIVMGIMLGIFLIIGIRSFLQVKELSAQADLEELKLKEITEWFRSSYTAEDINGHIALNQSEEQLYFSRYEVMNRLIAEKYPQLEESLSDHIIELLYTELFS